MKSCVAIAVAIALLLCGCAPSSAPSDAQNSAATPVYEAQAARYGGTLSICDGRTVDVLGYPAGMTSGTPIRHAAPALETLFQLDEAGNVQPKLAVSYETFTEDGVLVLHLREGVSFHDGTPFDAEAVKWNLTQQVASSGTGTSNISALEVLDAFTLAIHLTKWDNTLLMSLCQVEGMMISPTAYRAHGGKEWASKHPVGTGPFLFSSMASDGTITYIRNPNYWQEGKPYLDAIVIHCDRDSSRREYRFRNGTYNVLIRGDITSLAGFSAEGYKVNSVSNTGPWGFLFDSANSRSPFSNLAVRQAVCYAVDNAYLVHNVYLDTVVETNQYAMPGMTTYNTDVKGYPFDLAAARALMRQAGYENGFTTTYTYDSTADNADALAHALQEMLSEIDITLTLNPVSNSESTRMLLGGEGWQGIMGTFGSSQFDTLTQLYHYMVGDEKYASMLKPERLITSINDAITAPEGEALQYIYDVQKLLIDEECLCYYYFANKDYTVLAKNVHDTSLSSMMPVTMWTPADAWIS